MFLSIAGGLLILIAGLSGYAVGYPWVFPSLGQTIFIHTISPSHKTASIYNTFIGHMIGILAGYAAIWLTGALHTPSVLGSEHLLLPRVWASGLAVSPTILFETIFNAIHPPAAATTLLIALSGFKASGKDIIVLIIGVSIATITGELTRRLLALKKQKELNMNNKIRNTK